MIGDYYLASPLVKSSLSRTKGFGLSLFEKLCELDIEHVSVLMRQYRMNSFIMELSNALVYKGIMKVGSQEVSDQAIEYPTNVNSSFDWLK